MSGAKTNSSLVSLPYISLDEDKISDIVLRDLFCHAKKAISCLDICELIRDLCQSESQKDSEKSGLIITEKIQKQYNYILKVSFAIAKKIQGRVTITLPDGHVIVDTCKGQGNSYENYVDDIISENHNTRVCVFQAQCGSDGVSYERKFSSTTHRNEVYLAVRLGPFRNSVGTLRLSIPDC